MVTKSEAGAVIAGATIGTAQTPLIRQYVDKEWKNPDGTYKYVKSLKGFGTPSALSGISLGLLTNVLGVAGAYGQGPVKNREATKAGLLAYGIPALVGGIFSGAFPAIPITAGQLGEQIPGSVMQQLSNQINALRNENAQLRGSIEAMRSSEKVPLARYSRTHQTGYMRESEMPPVFMTGTGEKLSSKEMERAMGFE